MPRHHDALKKLLEAVEQKMTQAETHLLNATSDDERESLVETLADLHIRHSDLKAALTGDDLSH